MPTAGKRVQGIVDAVFRRRPMLPIVVCLILGVASHKSISPHTGWWIGLTASVSVAAALLFRRAAVCSCLLLVAVYLAGVSAAQLEAFYFASHDIAAYASDDPRIAQLELRIDQVPRIQVAVGQPRPLPPKETVTATALRIRTHGSAGDQWSETSGSLILRLEQPHPRLAAGMRLRAIGRLQRPSTPMNPGQFDWAAYYREHRILSGLTVSHPDGVEILEAQTPSPLERLREATRRLLADGFASSQSHDHAALRALLLGDRDAEMRDVQDGFSKVGAAHLLAVSGLHVAIVATFIYLLCRWFRVPPRAAAWLMMTAVLFYGLIVLPATPALRAVTLCLLFGSGMLQRRVADRMQILAISCAAMLLYHPLDLYSAGFQLSFGTVFGLILFAPHINRFVASLEDQHMKVARAFRPPTFWQRAWLRGKRMLLDYLLFGLVAWLISAPLVATHFNQLNPWAILSGLCLLPLVVLGVIGGLAKLVLSLLFPGFSTVWAVLSLLPIKGIEHLIAALERLPGTDIPLATPAPWMVIAYYGLLTLPLLPSTLPALRRLKQAAPAAACALVIGLPFIGAARRPNTDSDTRITLLAIGAGQIAVVELSNGDVFLIDDGSSSMTDPLRTCLAPYLRSHGIRTVSSIYLSHPDFDHISATADTAADFETAHVVISPLFRSQCKGNAPAETLLDRLDTLRVPITLLARGGHIVLDNDTTLDALWPPPDRVIKSTNNAGLVLRLVCHGRSILFPADIQIDTERELMRQENQLKSDVLVAPHHGSAEATTAEFLRAVAPSVIVSSNDRTLSHKQREFDKLAADKPLYRTHRCGAITIVINRSGELRVETFLQVEPQRGGLTRAR